MIRPFMEDNRSYEQMAEKELLQWEAREARLERLVDSFIAVIRTSDDVHNDLADLLVEALDNGEDYNELVDARREAIEQTKLWRVK